jgi:hypothetical protein
MAKKADPPKEYEIYESSPGKPFERPILDDIKDDIMEMFIGPSPDYTRLYITQNYMIEFKEDIKIKLYTCTNKEIIENIELFAHIHYIKKGLFRANLSKDGLLFGTTKNNPI